IDGRMVYLWRAVDAEGEVLDVLVQTRRNKRAALKLMRKLLKKYVFFPDKLSLLDTGIIWRGRWAPIALPLPEADRTFVDAERCRKISLRHAGEGPRRAQL